MIRILALAGALAVSIVTQPAYAADVAGIGCVEDTLGATAVKTIRDDIAAKLIAGKTLPESFDRSSISAPLESCIARQKLSPDAAAAFAEYSIAHLIRPSVERALRAVGGDPAPIAEAYTAFPYAIRDKLRAGITPEEARTTVLPPLQQRGVGVNSMLGAGRLLGILSILEFSRAKFIAS